MANRKFTEEQELKIIERLVNGESTTALANEYGVARKTIANVKTRHADFTSKVSHKKDEDIKSILDHMDAMKGDACRLLDTLLAAMEDKEKVEKATLNQIATAFGIVVDKFTSREQPKQDNRAKNNLLEALAGIAKPERFDDEV